MNFVTYFPEPFMFSEPNISEEESKAMVEYFDECPRPAEGAQNYTGDVADDEQILSKEPFKPLIPYIKHSAVELLKIITNEYTLYDVHVVKSWPVVLTKGCSVSPHAHRGNHFSFVYYVQAQRDVGGDLIFQRPRSHSLLEMGFTNDDLTEPFSGMYAVCPPQTNGMIMWPSCMDHFVDDLHSETPRYSLSGDIIVTKNKGGIQENKLTNPSRWVTM